MPVRILIFSALIFVSLNSFSQQKKSREPKAAKQEKKKKEKKLPENIESFPKNFLVRIKYIYPLVSVNVSSRLQGAGDKFIYLPGMPGVVGGAIKIKKAYISAAVQLPSNDALKRKYGDSKFRNIFINIQGRIVQWGIFFRNYKGFYLKNYQKFYPDWKQDSLGYPQSKGLSILETGLNLGFNFNKSFSMNAAFTQGERQKKSAGSFLLGISERYQRIVADTNFVPPTQDVFYPNLDRLRYGNFATTLISAGIGYQIVMGKFHITPVLMAGSGIQVQNYVQYHRRHVRLNIPTYASAKGQIGYNGDHFFINFIYINEFNTIPIKESRIRLFHNWYEAGMGVRF